MEFCFTARYKSPIVQYWCESKIGGKGNEGPGVLNPIEEDYVHVYFLSSKTLWGKGEADESIPQKQLKIPCQIFDWDSDRSQESFMVLTGIHPRKGITPKCHLVWHNVYLSLNFQPKPSR